MKRGSSATDGGRTAWTVALTKLSTSAPKNAAVLVKMPKIAGAPRHMRTVNQTTRFRCADRVCAGQRSWIACMRARTASSRTYMIAPPSAGHVLIAPKLNMATSALG